MKSKMHSLKKILRRSTQEELQCSSEIEEETQQQTPPLKPKRKKKKHLKNKGPHSLLVLSSIIVCSNINIYKGRNGGEVPYDILQCLLCVMRRYSLLSDETLGFFLSEKDRSLDLQMTEKTERLSDNSLNLIAMCCPKLEKLSLRNWSNISNEGLKQFCELAASTSSSSSLQSLSIIDIPKLSADILPSFGKSFKHITSFDFSYSIKMKSQDLLVLADHYSDTLLELRLQGNILKNHEVSVIANQFPHLEILDISVPIFNPKKIYASPEVIAELSHLKNLKDLSLSGLLFDDFSILQIVKQCSYLQTLILGYGKENDSNYSVKITDVAIHAIADHCGNLVELSLARCNRITSEKSLVRTLLPAIPKIEKLNLSGLTCVTDKTVIAISQHLHQIKRLKLHQCVISSHSVECLGHHCHSLVYLDIRTNNIINNSAYESIAEGCPNLETLLAFMSPESRLTLQLRCHNLKFKSKKETIYTFCQSCFDDRTDLSPQLPSPSSSPQQ